MPKRTILLRSATRTISGTHAERELRKKPPA